MKNYITPGFIGAAIAALSLGLTSCETVRLDRVRLVSQADSCYASVYLSNGTNYVQKIPQKMCDTLPVTGVFELEFPKETAVVDTVVADSTRPVGY